jgi:hypothetical protein
LDIGGSTALILAGHLRRATEDIDVVDQLPPSIRMNHELLSKLGTRFGLRLAHFQSHYLPSGWSARVRSLGRFGSIDVHLVDPLDIFVGKLFSNREKDRDDLRVLKKSLEKPAITERLQSSAKILAGEPAIRVNAERNWYILFGESLPT